MEVRKVNLNECTWYIGKYMISFERVIRYYYAKLILTSIAQGCSCMCANNVSPFCFPAGQSISAAESTGATVAGSFLGGLAAGGAVALLAVGILCGSWKLKHSSGKSRKGNSEEEK